MAKKKSSSNGMKAGAGILTAALVAAAAGAYLMSGKEGEKRRAKAKAWAVKAQKEVAKQLKSAKKLGEGEYKKIVDAAVKRYGAMADVDMSEVMKVAQDMKGHWKQIQSDAKKMAVITKKKGKQVASGRKTVKKKAMKRK